jgi:hypothetical protein
MSKSISTILIVLLSMSLLTFMHNGMTTEAQLPPNMPVVFVDPLNASAAVGETFMVAVKVFNLTCNFYGTDEEWTPGNPLPPEAHHPDPRYNYSLGNLYSFSISMSWDPTLLQYVDHHVMVPVETYPQGILNSPADKIEDKVNATGGTCLVTYGSRNPAEEFNKPNDNATVFKIIFTVKAQGSCDLSLDEVTLYQRKVKFPDAAHRIPYWAMNGHFETLTGLYVSEVTTLKYERILAAGQNLDFNVTIVNEGETPETFNLTVSTENETGVDPILFQGELTMEPGNTTTITLTVVTVIGEYCVLRLDVYIDSTGHTRTSWIILVMAGDVDGDRDVDIYDVVALCGVYGLKEGDPKYDPDKDIIPNGNINIYDVVLMCSNYGLTY